MQNLGLGLNLGLFGVDSSRGMGNEGNVVFDRSASVFTEANPVMTPPIWPDFRLAGRDTGSFGTLNSVFISSFSAFTDVFACFGVFSCDPADFRFSEFFLFFGPDDFVFSAISASGSAGDLVNVNMPSSLVALFVETPPRLFVGRLFFDLTTEGWTGFFVVISARGARFFADKLTLVAFLISSRSEFSFSVEILKVDSFLFGLSRRWS